MVVRRTRKKRWGKIGAPGSARRRAWCRKIARGGSRRRSRRRR